MKENSEAKMNERKKETQVAFTDFQSGRGRQGTEECGWSKEVKMVLSWLPVETLQPQGTELYQYLKEHGKSPLHRASRKKYSPPNNLSLAQWHFWPTG